MKKFLLLVSLAIGISHSLKAANFNIDINGFTYTPDDLVVNVGDVVVIDAQSFHPLQQVSEATWNVNGNTALPGGFFSTTPFTLTITAGMAGATIFYVCAAHAATGMKGRIRVNVTSSIDENRVLDFNFTVFPNPVTPASRINISTKKISDVSILLYDASGRVVQQVVKFKMQPGEITLPFSAVALSKGTYYLLMRTNEGILKRQIVVY